MADPMKPARLDEISALADQYREKRAAAQNALIDHDRSEVLRQESYAGCIAEIFTQEYGPELIAEVRRATAAEAAARTEHADMRLQLDQANDAAYGAARAKEIRRIQAIEAEVERLRAENAELEKRDDWLRSLEAAGVDNWEGIDAANEIHEREA